MYNVLGAVLPKLPKLLKTEEYLRQEAVHFLKLVATPTRVHALRSNPVLGKVWRAVAAFRRHDDSVAQLCDSFGAAV